MASLEDLQHAASTATPVKVTLQEFQAAQQSGQPIYAVPTSENGGETVVAVDGTPEGVIHVLPSHPSLRTVALTQGTPTSVSGAHILNSPNVQTITISAGNLSFPVTIANPTVVSNLKVAVGLEILN